MKCDDVRGLFSEYFDGEAAREDEAAVSVHLRKCAACMLEYEEFCGLLSELQNLPEPQLPEGFSDALRQAVNDSRQVQMNKRNRWRTAYRSFALAAAAGILFAVVWFSGMLDFGYDEPVPMAGDFAFEPMMGYISGEESVSIVPNNEMLPLPYDFRLHETAHDENGIQLFPRVDRMEPGEWMCECDADYCEFKYGNRRAYEHQDINIEDFYDTDVAYVEYRRAEYRGVMPIPVGIQLDDTQETSTTETATAIILPLVIGVIIAVITATIATIVLISIKKRQK